MQKTKKCINCGEEIPKESAFCLLCFTSLETFEPEKTQHIPKPLPFFKSKRFWLGIAGAAVFLFIMGACIIAMKSVNSSPPPMPETSIIYGTETVAVTEENGEAVTGENGEQVFDVIEVTQTITLPVTTEKQGFLANLFNDKDSHQENPSQNGNTAEETDKKGFLENLFKPESTTQPQTKPAQPSTTEPSTVKPTQGGTSAPVTQPVSPQTTIPQTTIPQTTPLTTLPPETTIPQTPITDFEYSISGKYATISSYTGNDKHVVIPAVIDGCAVTSINGNTFLNNDTVDTITFESNSKQPYLWVRSQTFNGCPNLRVINFPETDLGIINNFATNCPSVEKLSVTGYQFQFIDGTLYYNTGSTWKVRYHCPASPVTELRLPEYCTGFESAINLDEAKNIKNIYINKNVISFPPSDQIPPNCENIFVDSGNPYAHDENGVAFHKTSRGYLCYYPPKNKTTSITLPENTILYARYIDNPYLKTLYVPKTTDIDFVESILNKSAFSALENLYIGTGHEDADYILKKSQIENTQLY